MADTIGTNGTDILDGTTDPDTIQGLGGRDTLNGLEGADILSGGDGSDHLNGGDGDDTLYGHSVADLDPTSGNIAVTLLADVGQGALFVTGAPGDDGFVYSVEQTTGEITRIDTTSGAQSMFLDIPDSEFSITGERGVLGLAFHPDYATNGRFFVFAVNAVNGDLEVREYERSSGDPTVANPTLVKTLIAIPHPDFSNHNGGFIGFGPDGYLYITTGDGGSGNDPNGNGQNINILLGKILRIDVNGDDFPADSTRNYAIPADNPLAGATPGADEIWDYGLRNPFRISFDSATGDLYIGDVGQSTREEVDFEPAGGHGGVNYGWSLREGFGPRPGAPPSSPLDFTDPVYDYGHTFGRSIIGGYVNHAPVGGLQGSYVFGDFVSGRLVSLRMVDGVAEEVIDHTQQITGGNLGNISSFGTDNAGNLYAVSYSGGIYRLTPGLAAGDQADVLDGGAGDDSLYGGQGNDMLTGGADADHIDGGAGIDTASYAGSAAVQVSLQAGTGTGGDAQGDTLTGVENLIGSAFGDQLTGDGGVNVLDGGTGGDTLTGLGGNDTYYVDGTGDTVIEAVGGGVDTVFASGDHALAANQEVEFLTANAGSTALTLTGNNLANTITSGAGGDTLIGLGGNDIYYVNSSADVVTEAAGGGSDTVFASVSYALQANQEVEALKSNAGTTGLTLTGNNLTNSLLSGLGVDTLIGLGGNDAYYVYNSADLVVEAVGGGADRVKANVNFTLGANQEIEVVIASAGATGLTLTGNNLATAFQSGAGNDTMAGLGGNDAYYVNNAGDIVTEAVGGGTDTVKAAANYALQANQEIEFLTADAGSTALTLTGNNLANTLTSGAGSDTLIGLGGNDIYYVNSLTDLVTEAVGGGSDTVNAAVSYALQAGQEVEFLTANAGAAAVTLTGNNLANTLTSGAGNDTLIGLGGNDSYNVNNAGDAVTEAVGGGTDTVYAKVGYTLQANQEIETLVANAGSTALTLTGNDLANTLMSGAGSDTLIGLGGNDKYYVNSALDKVTEAVGGGADTVYASVSYALQAGQETDVLSANAGASGLTLTGNSFANALVSGLGSDTLAGLGGNDTYYVNNSSDIVNEAASAGTDTVRTTVSYVLQAGEIETLLANAGATGLSLTGNNLNNYLIGNAGADTLTGGLGTDILAGGQGNDAFVFNAVAESAAGAPDSILDFTAGDQLDLHLIDADGNDGNGDNAFVLDSLGNNSFAIGHIRQTVSGTTLFLDFNANADAASEMRIALLNHGAAIGSGDIIA